MRGLKTQESGKFNRFWTLIQAAAAQENCVFFGYAGEGRDFPLTIWKARILSGGWFQPKTRIRLNRNGALGHLSYSAHCLLALDSPLRSGKRNPEK